MRLGGPVFEKYENPDQWARAIRALGYRAAYCPVALDAPQDVVGAYESAAAKADIVIAEVGVWNSPLSPDAAARAAALEKCKKSLALADAISARCCVNVSGSRGSAWFGPSELDMTRETFDMIVNYVRDIIDTVKPRRTFYTLETMQWMYPDSTQSYADLMKAIDRKKFAVHFDPVNLVCSPQCYYRNSEIIKDFVARLGPHIRSCHAKDILLHERFTVHLDEVRPGCGKLDYRTYLAEIAKLPGDIPVMLEHLPNAEEYSAAAQYVRQIAKTGKIDL